MCVLLVLLCGIAHVANTEAASLSLTKNLAIETEPTENLAIVAAPTTNTIAAAPTTNTIAVAPTRNTTETAPPINVTTAAAPTTIATPTALPPIQGRWPGIELDELRLKVMHAATEPDDELRLLLVDVRNVSELLSPGRIPHTFNVPLHELDAALQLSDDAFRRRYGFRLPASSTREIVLTCRSGRRAQVAAVRLRAARGYTRLRIYYGSFNEWSAAGQPFSRQVGIAMLNDTILHRRGTIVDIRERSERQQTGYIPSSCSVPQSELAAALQLPPAEFRRNYSFEKPPRSQELVVVGRDGAQVLTALPTFDNNNYCKLQLYLGVM